VPICALRGGAGTGLLTSCGSAADPLDAKDAASSTLAARTICFEETNIVDAPEERKLNSFLCDFVRKTLNQELARSGDMV
jgi:hypothetical protein